MQGRAEQPILRREMAQKLTYPGNGQLLVKEQGPRADQAEDGLTTFRENGKYSEEGRC